MRALKIAAIALCVAHGASAAPFFTPTKPAAGTSARRVGIYPLERLGPADPAYDKVQAYLKKNLASFPQVEAFDIATPQRCKADDLNCLVGVGHLSDAELVVHGSVERFQNGYAVRLQLIDVGKTTRREVKRFINGGSADLVAAMELSACELVTSEKCQGTLKVAGVAGAQVLVEAKDVGTTPYEAPVAIGRVPVRVAKDGLSTEDRFVNVSFHQETLLQVQQQNGRLVFVDDFDAVPLPPELALPEIPDDAPPQAPAPKAPEKVATAPKAAPPAAKPAPKPSETTERIDARGDGRPGSSTLVAVAPEDPSKRPESANWMPTAFYASAGVGGAALLTGAVFGLLANSSAATVNDKYDRHELTVADKPLYAEARSRASMANVSYGIAGLGLAAAVVMYLVDPAVAGGGGDAGLTVGPTGVGARGSF